MPDAQAALGFLIEQASFIEAEVYKVAYPDIQYPQLIPVDTSAPEWAKSVTFYSMDKAGRAASPEMAINRPVTTVPNSRIIPAKPTTSSVLR